MNIISKSKKKKNVRYIGRAAILYISITLTVSLHLTHAHTYIIIIQFNGFIQMCCVVLCSFLLLWLKNINARNIHKRNIEEKKTQKQHGTRTTTAATATMKKINKKERKSCIYDQINPSIDWFDSVWENDLQIKISYTTN